MASTQEIVVNVEPRSEFGKNACGRIRRAGKVPAVVYGLDKAPYSVNVEPRRVEELLRSGTGRNTLFKLAMEGGAKTRQVMIRDLQRDPVTERIVHIDFVRVDPEKRMHVQVPVRLVGLAEGVKNEGGVLDFVNRTVEVACLPSQIPDGFDIDVSELHVGQHVSVKDLAETAAEVEILDDAETIIAVVAISRAEVSTTEEEAVEGEVAEGEAAEGEAEGDEAKTDKEGDQDADKK